MIASLRCRHPRLVLGACRVYRLALWLYPPSLRRDFHHELLVTFKSQAEDAVNRASVTALLLFVLHLAADWLRTFTLESNPAPTLSLLGLGAGDDQACGSIDGTTFTASLFLATLGVVLLVAGWYGWLSMSAEIMSVHRSI